MPDADGSIREVLVGVGEGLWDWAGLPTALPPHAYHLADALNVEQANHAALGWALGTYRFDRLKQTPEEEKHAVLAWPEGCDQRHVESAARATFFVRDLINAPASDMGPADLADSARATAEDHGASIRIVVGDELLDKGFPAVHAVGRAAASDRAPRRVDEPESHPRR